MQCTLSCRTAAMRMHTAKAGAVLYKTQGGLHYVAFSPTAQQGSLRFFNAVYGMHSHVQSLGHFARAYIKVPLALYFTVS